MLLAHGEGARLTRNLIRDILLEAFDNEFLRPLADGAVLPPCEGRLVVTTDGFVVSPLFFPGGDIGSLAVHGTINDLAVSGAIPTYITLGLIVEEGLLLTTLRRVVQSIGEAARACGVSVVTGDTKVVPHGAADGLFVHTTGIGRLRPGIDWGTHRVRPGDRILVNGSIGEHGMAILAAREHFDLGVTLVSDTAPLHELVEAICATSLDVHFVRDATRGGVSAVLHELVRSADVSVVLDESALPVSDPVRGACEILGLDPLHVACEGRLVAVVAGECAERAVAAMQSHRLGTGTALIGEVVGGDIGVVVRGILGVHRSLDEPTGAPLPRIC